MPTTTVSTLLLASSVATAGELEAFAGLLVDRDYVENDKARVGADLELLASSLLHLRLRQSLRRGPTGRTQETWEALASESVSSNAEAQAQGWWETRGRWEAGARVPVEAGIPGASLLVGGGLCAWIFTNGDMAREFEETLNATANYTDSLRAGGYGELGLRGDAGELELQGLASLTILAPVTTWGGELRREQWGSYEEYQQYYLDTYGEELAHRDFIGNAVAVRLEGQASYRLFQARLQLGAGRYGRSQYSQLQAPGLDTDFVLGLDLSVGVLLGA